ncbi:lipoprotein [Mycoplasma capricolum]|uniref:lipoprotein n=1 Tax=Mycoplasma capricolum TaxID=2095 RepID=UPI000B30F7AB|nr:lipoprotein [Mycoplasma capricolum]
MKKLLTLLGLVTLIATTSVAVIACGGTRSEQKITDTEKKMIKKNLKKKKKNLSQFLVIKQKKKLLN